MNKNQSFKNQQLPLVTQELIAPAAIKQQHLVANPVRTGDLYYGLYGGNFTGLAVGTTGQVLMVIGGFPSWQSFPETGLAAAKPTSGRFTGDQYYSTDTKVFNVWDGAAWRTTTLT